MVRMKSERGYKAAGAVAAAVIFSLWTGYVHAYSLPSAFFQSRENGFQRERSVAVLHSSQQDISSGSNLQALRKIQNHTASTETGQKSVPKMWKTETHADTEGQKDPDSGIFRLYGTGPDLFGYLADFLESLQPAASAEIRPVINGVYRNGMDRNIKKNWLKGKNEDGQIRVSVRSSADAANAQQLQSSRLKDGQKEKEEEIFHPEQREPVTADDSGTVDASAQSGETAESAMDCTVFDIPEQESEFWEDKPIDLWEQTEEYEETAAEMDSLSAVSIIEIEYEEAEDWGNSMPPESVPFQRSLQDRSRQSDSGSDPYSCVQADLSRVDYDFEEACSLHFLQALQKGEKHLYYNTDRELARASLSEIVSIYCSSDRSLPFFHCTENGKSWLELSEEDAEYLHGLIQKADADWLRYLEEIRWLCAQIDIRLGDKEKFEKINALICERYTYEVTNRSMGDFVRTGRGQCWHFAKIFQDVCLAAGLEASMKSDPGHSWDTVIFEGKEYRFDPAFNATCGNIQTYIWQ